MVTFTEIDGAGNPRHVTIFACHAPPNNLPPILAATQFMGRLPTMADIANAPAALETKVICGDFNLNLLNPNGTDANPYAGLTNIGYTRLLAPPVPGPAPPIPDAYKGYFATHIKPKPSPSPGNANDLFLWSSNAAQSPYPGYGYIGSSFINNFYSIDNVLIRPHLGPPVQTLTVVNSVVGTPMDAVLNPPGNAPCGVDKFNNDVQNILGWPDTPNAQGFQIGMAGNRVGWENYGHIRNTSDHFALLATI